ncbi:exo-alpha-sialidase [Candidatus Saccharibacteria bacterium]|nr:exo-alpha-sialidase [Candidatus Saccharibacteria bacterium]
MFKHKQDGFAHYLLLVLMLVVIGVVGYFSYIKVFKKAEPDQPSSSQTQKTSSAKTPNSNSQNYNWSEMPQGPYHDSVYFVVSNRIDQWPKTPGTLLQEHASVPDVIEKDGVLYLYFVDVSTDGLPEQIGLRTSTDDGETWSDRQFIAIEGVGDRVPVDPAPFLLADGRIRLFYLDFSTARSGSGTHGIYSAISEDGLNFTQEDSARFEYSNIDVPDVVQFGDLWRMYTGTGDLKVISATSTDGLNFTYEGVAYSGGAIPNVILDRSTYYLFTGGIDIATSNDGQTFTKTNSNYNPGAMAADPGVVKLSNGSYLMVYKSSDLKPTDPPKN